MGRKLSAGLWEQNLGLGVVSARRRKCRCLEAMREGKVRVERQKLVYAGLKRDVQVLQ